MYMHGSAKKLVLGKDIASTYTDPVRPWMRPPVSPIEPCPAGPVMTYMKSATRPATSFAFDHMPPLTSLNSLAMRQPLSGYRLGDGMPSGGTSSTPPTKMPPSNTGVTYPPKGPPTDDVTATSYPSNVSGRVPPTIIWFALAVSVYLFARNRGG